MSIQAHLCNAHSCGMLDTHPGAKHLHHPIMSGQRAGRNESYYVRECPPSSARRHTSPAKKQALGRLMDCCCPKHLSIQQTEVYGIHIFFFFGDGVSLFYLFLFFLLPAGQSTAPPKNGPGVSQAHVPTHIRAGDDHAAAA
jgi:hypothetical protein